jgi:hypothetical protein
MNASVSQKMGWVISRFDDRLDAQDGNHPVFRIPAPIPSGAELLFQNY